MIRYYKYKYYMNCLSEDRHQDAGITYEITLNVLSKENRTFLFNDYDRKFAAFFTSFRGKRLSEFPELFSSRPELQTIGNGLFDLIGQELEKDDYTLIQLEVSETPIRVYIVSDRILVPTYYVHDAADRFRQISEMRKRYL